MVKPCPVTCKFDWIAFHKQLDIAFAHFIEEDESERHNYTQRPIMELLEYSNAKQLAQKDAQGERQQ